MAETPEEAHARRLRQTAETAGSIAPSKMWFVEGPHRTTLRAEWRAGGLRRIKVVCFLGSFLLGPAVLVVGGMRALAVYLLILSLIVLGLGAFMAISGIVRTRARR